MTPNADTGGRYASDEIRALWGRFEDRAIEFADCYIEPRWRDIFRYCLGIVEKYEPQQWHDDIEEDGVPGKTIEDGQTLDEQTEAAARLARNDS